MGGTGEVSSLVQPSCSRFICEEVEVDMVALLFRFCLEPWLKEYVSCSGFGNIVNRDLGNMSWMKDTSSALPSLFPFTFLPLVSLSHSQGTLTCYTLDIKTSSAPNALIIFPRWRRKDPLINLNTDPPNAVSPVSQPLYTNNHISVYPNTKWL